MLQATAEIIEGMQQRDTDGAVVEYSPAPAALRLRTCSCSWWEAHADDARHFWIGIIGGVVVRQYQISKKTEKRNRERTDM